MAFFISVSWNVVTYNILFLKYGFYDLILYLPVDVTVYHRGFHGDLNETFLIGNVSPEAKKLVQVTSECLLKAINIGKN